MTGFYWACNSMEGDKEKVEWCEERGPRKEHACLTPESIFQHLELYKDTRCLSIVWTPPSTHIMPCDAFNSGSFPDCEN